jgi:hypothetical protein
MCASTWQTRSTVSNPPPLLNITTVGSLHKHRSQSRHPHSQTLNTKAAAYISHRLPSSPFSCSRRRSQPVLRSSPPPPPPPLRSASGHFRQHGVFHSPFHAPLISSCRRIFLALAIMNPVWFDVSASRSVLCVSAVVCSLLHDSCFLADYISDSLFFRELLDIESVSQAY